MKESNESFAASALSGEAIPTAGDSTNTFSVSQPAVKTLTNVKEHEIHLEGAFNVRDMGGYPTKDGLVVKNGVLLRSARLNRLTKMDINKLINTYNLAIDFDLRRPEEVSERPDVTIPGVKYINDSVDTRETYYYHINVENNRKHYRTYVTSTQARKVYHDLFMTLLNKPMGKALLWHCTSGKDRTGVAAALILYVLGVDSKTIFKDYVASNTFLKGQIDQRITRLKAKGASHAEIKFAKVDGGVDLSYLKAVIDEMHKDYGSVDEFITEGLSVTKEQQERLKEMYLE
ncbi:tyrosine-protein phosphatase [Lentilactobacillus kefiri]|uniref:Protein tyrosine serine phosphatase n=2 Tax=Lentilactobacillus kefiri TaxID=33962 RepID=A0A8E1RKI6_LENKE|nr:tyrosine-protein phosphatase [Lentilactobacillus kefiri]KRL59239.1 protein tyrosine serine phosphatase [Lentilactobacillus parakefiri DSM 10551]KRM53562.1 protein tyrosine serine phosphatase [Lentilactobacillus kefiri DSM 20587 = JCM 5818]MCJ2162452.1 tyrosine-protein phosphatase [Lentilactobacillus kefiri]MCP9369629.1 tyrosine-protein phosphatase [Lentilactobacillus kefiri]MDH5109321.1 tyrosine-protein phosphatase [Lentilactobacillus kefiri]